MSNIKEFKGVWFLPNSKEQIVSGVLAYNPDENFSTLELIGAFEEFQSTEIILGVTNECKEITLFNCYAASGGIIQKSLNIKVPLQSISLVSYKVQFIFQNIHIENPSNLLFNSISCQIIHLEDWIGKTGLIKTEEQGELVVRYKQPDPIKFSSDNFEGQIEFSVNEPIFNITHSIQLKQYVSLNLKSEEPHSLGRLLYQIYKFQDFLVMILNEHTHAENIVLYSDEFYNEVEGIRKTDNGPEYAKIKLPIKIILLCHIGKKANMISRKNAMTMLFSYKQIEKEFPEIINNWYKMYDTFEPALNLLFNDYYIQSKTLTNSFLNLAQAIETLHARLNPKKKQVEVDDKEMKRIREMIKAAIPDREKWINEQINNRLHLKLRVEDMVEKYSTEFFIDTIENDKDKFVTKFKDSRNYYTHYSNDLKDKALDGIELVRLIAKIKLLLISALLIEVGMPKLKVNSILKNKGKLIYKDYESL